MTDHSDPDFRRGPSTHTLTSHQSNELLTTIISNLTTYIHTYIKGMVSLKHEIPACIGSTT